jgi:signal transduction histidine kinase
VALRVTDNGQGFLLTDGQMSHGLGLRLMHERIEELHGSFELNTAPGRGTRVVASLPQELIREECAAHREAYP